MTIYCDESGGVGAGVIVVAAISLPGTMADELLTRIRDVIGLRGELKGSRITMAERAFVIELLARTGARTIVVQALTRDLAAAAASGKPPSDLAIYAHLLEHVVDAWLPETGGCVELVIDDGRYDARLNSMVRDDVQRALGQWGKASLADSRRSAGVQFADVLANSFFQMATGSDRAPRLETLMAPFLENGAIRHLTIKAIN
ncbi:DUF3800 domain-containing protein [Sphingomonas lacunae]|uniref:DUF3800 domain-containing protein n=1 Tax=Sphingomonas lacunae TaxID=2698828 RepID=A0A6M4AQ83_9SPHN|nr:DUF3800 domain-containing protein [Sphingomonas lacunae]QJQ31185.1 DUF3800 domain-containing protein [Sphingomonas lacunae]